MIATSDVLTMVISKFTRNRLKQILRRDRQPESTNIAEYDDPRCVDDEQPSSDDIGAAFFDGFFILSRLVNIVIHEYNGTACVLQKRQNTLDLVDKPRNR